MANRFVSPREQVFDGVGAPLPGAKLYFYLSGTSTPAVTWSDAGLTVPNANPVIADSAGRFGDIFLGGQAMKAVLQDAGGATIWTADPVTPDLLAGAFIIAQGTTASLSLSQQLGFEVWLEQFGGKGDGITDNTQAFAQALSTGKSVRLMPGRYLSGPITLGATGQKIIGSAVGASTLVARDNAPFVTLNGLSGHEGKGLLNLTLDCSVHTAAAGNYGVGIKNSGRTIIENVAVVGAGTAYYVEACNHVVFSAANAAECKVKAFDIWGGSGSARTDLVFFFGCIGVGKDTDAGEINPNCTGFEVRGMVNSVTFHSAAAVNVGTGMNFDATDAEFAAGRIPAIIYGFDVGVDFSWNENFRFRRAADVFLTTIYTNNAHNANGVVIEEGCTNFRLDGLRGGGHAGAGLVIRGKDIQIANSAMAFSSQGFVYEGYGTKLLKYPAVEIGSTARNVSITGGRLGSRTGIGATCRNTVLIQAGAQNVTIDGADLNGAGSMPIRNVAAEGQVIIGPCAGVPYTVVNGTMTANRRGLFAYAEVTGLSPSGAITAISVLDGGSGYSAAYPPAVVISAMQGSGATATATVGADGSITGVTVTAGGSGYVGDNAVCIAIDGPPTQPYIAPYARAPAGVDMTVKANGSFAVNLGNSLGTSARLTASNADVAFPLLEATADNAASITVGGSADHADLRLTPKGANGRLRLGGPTQPSAGAVVGYQRVKVADGTEYAIPLHAIT